jgi:rubredoxin
MELRPHNNIIRMLVKGGVLSPSYFMKILDVAAMAGNCAIGFGSRQDVIFDVPKNLEVPVLEELKQLKIEFILRSDEGPKRQNIVSSYVSADIEASTQWLNAGNFLQILDLFGFSPQLRINIVDSRQTMVPLFYGHLNFVAAPARHYWFLYLRLHADLKPYQWPVLVYSSDIAALSQSIEKRWLQGGIKDMDALSREVLSTGQYNSKDVSDPLTHPKSFSADYEGFGRMLESKNHWAGFYWRNNQYPIAFLKEVCQRCLDTGLSKIAITPWKSFIVKDIAEKDFMQWQALSGRQGINMRHSAYDLNWHLPLGSVAALRLKRSIVKQFDKGDVCVHGLTFGITYGREMPFCSIMIQVQPESWLSHFFPSLKRYDVLIADGFDPNTGLYELFESSFALHQLADVLTRATALYYQQLAEKTSEGIPPERSPMPENYVYQCPNCQTVYLPEMGAPDVNIGAGTPFVSLPKSYSCPLCETPKAYFQRVNLSLLKSA